MRSRSQSTVSPQPHDCWCRDAISYAVTAVSTAIPRENVWVERVRSFATGVLGAVGMPEDDAALAANAMVWAELRDLPMHGVTGKLPQCVRRIRAGVTAARVSWTPVRETASSVLFDAKDAWGQVAGVRAMRAAIAKPSTTGVVMASGRNSSSAAAMGHSASLAMEDRMIGVAIPKAPPLLPPPGGTTRVVGNQGFAIGAPSGRHRPLLFDFPLSLISTSEIHTAHARGQPLPPGLI